MEFTSIEWNCILFQIYSKYHDLAILSISKLLILHSTNLISCSLISAQCRLNVSLSVLCSHCVSKRVNGLYLYRAFSSLDNHSKRFTVQFMAIQPFRHTYSASMGSTLSMRGNSGFSILPKDTCFCYWRYDATHTSSPLLRLCFS